MSDPDPISTPDSQLGPDPDLDRPGPSRETIEAFERYFAALTASFLGYVVRTSGVEVRDDLDRRVLAVYEEWLRDEEACAWSMAELIEDHGGNAVRGAAPLGYSQYNYLGAAYLLRQVIAAAERLVADLRDSLARDALADPAPSAAATGSARLTPEMRALVARAIEVEERHILRARELLGSAVRPPQPPPRPRGASAARW